MSGHNKWSTIKHKKAAADAKKGKVFSRIARELMLAARQGGTDEATNASLRAAVQKARSVNMPSDNVERAIKKGAGDLDGATLEELVYEGYATGGIALVVECLSDNKNRTAAEVKHIFSRHGGNLSAQGSVSRLFQRKGQLAVPTDQASEDKLMEIILEAGADDMVREGDSFQIVTEHAAFMDVVDALNKAGISMTLSEVNLVADLVVPVEDKSKAASLMRFVEALEDLDDVQNVYTNADIGEDILNALEEE